jgi:small subunit ribosomal protein S10e
MQIPKSNQKMIQRHLFNEGVIVVKKDYHLVEHPLISVPNIHVMKTLQSLHSKALVSLVFSWQHYYYVLNEAGIKYIRQVLGLPETALPNTVSRPTGLMERSFSENRQGRGPSRQREGDKRFMNDRRAGLREIQQSTGNIQ